VTYVKNFDKALPLVDSVVNQVRTVNELAHSHPFSDCAAHVRETRK
jgi:hypothetical protein